MGGYIINECYADCDGKAWRKRSRIEKSRFKHCCICLSSPVEALHHLTYDNRGAERSQDFIGVCNKCHKMIEVLKPYRNADSYHVVIFLILAKIFIKSTKSFTHPLHKLTDLSMYSMGNYCHLDDRDEIVQKTKRNGIAWFASVLQPNVSTMYSRVVECLNSSKTS